MAQRRKRFEAPRMLTQFPTLDLAMVSRCGTEYVSHSSKKEEFPLPWTVFTRETLKWSKVIVNALINDQ